MPFHDGYFMKSGEEPFIDIRHLPNLVDGISTIECSSNGKQAHIGRLPEFLVDITDEIVLMRSQVREIFPSYMRTLTSAKPTNWSSIALIAF